MTGLVQLAKKEEETKPHFLFYIYINIPKDADKANRFFLFSKEQTADQ